MKSEYFNKRSQGTQLRGRREKPKPKQINWDRIVYFVLLFVGLGFLFYFIFVNTFYVEGEGLVVTETIEVRSPSDIEIREQLVSNDSYVVMGDPLFRYTLMNWTGTIDEIEEIEDNIADVEEEIQDLQDDIRLKRQAIQEIQKRIEFLEQEKEDFREKVRLNAATSYELNEVESSLFSARSNLRQAQSELNVLINNRNRLNEKRENLASEVQELQSGENKLQTYNSPVTGVINNISVQENRQAFRSDQILSIKPKNADVYIFSVFDREDAEYIQPGTVMNIEFDNGMKSTGVIRSSYDARSNLIEHFEQTGSLTTEYLVVELAPFDSTTRAQWFQLDRSGLSVYSSKIGRDELNSSSESSSNQISITDGAEKQPIQTAPDSNNSTQSDQASSSQTSTTVEQEPGETVNDSAVDADETNKSTGANEQYGLLGKSFNDQLDGYTINLYSLEDQERVKDIVNEIKEQGYIVDVHPVTIEQKEYWRIAVGQFKTIEDALVAAETVPATFGKEYFIHRIQ